MTTSFYVTLPSNGSMDTFPENTMAEFTNRLSKPIHLEGKWEVGMIECSYPRSWWQVNESTTHFSYKRIGNKTGREAAAVPWSGHKTIANLQNITLDTILNKTWINTRSERDFVVFDDPPFLNDRIVLKAADGYVLKFEGKICRSLGLKDPTDVGTGWVRAPYPWTSENIDHLFLYTDIIASHPVGDTEVPLLRQVAVGESGGNVGVTWPATAYFPVIKNPIETIRIEIRDGTGQKIPFTSGRTMVMLHFRPVLN